MTSSQYSFNQPLEDMSIDCDTCIKAITSLTVTKQPSSFPLISGEKVYLLTEQAYKYLLSKCTEEEAWDLGWLGQSEKHAVKSLMHPVLVEKLNHLKTLNDLNKNPSEHITHISTLGKINTPYCFKNKIWYYFDFESKQWIPSFISEQKLKHTLSQDTNLIYKIKKQINILVLEGASICGL